MTSPPVPPGWSALVPGAALTIVKLAPDGQEVTRYPAHVVAHGRDGYWLATRAAWTHRPVEVDGLWFRPGDLLEEFFSPVEWYNAFLVLAPGGEPRGWYANVTYPTQLKHDGGETLLIWRDLYIDVVVRADGTVSVRDEDELAESGLAEREPAIYRAILTARDLILSRIERRLYPFDQPGSGGGSGRRDEAGA